MRIIGPNGEIEVPIPAHTHWFFHDGVAQIIEGEEETQVHLARDGVNVWVSSAGCTAMFSPLSKDASAGKSELRAPMTGRVVSIPVKNGDIVKLGATVAVLEAMKMEYRLEAEIEGTVAEVGAAEGDLVDLGQLLVRLE